MQEKTTAEWLYRKGLLTDNELFAAQSLALLFEWRDASFSSPVSNQIFKRKYMETARRLQCMPYEFFLSDMELGTKPGSEDVEDVDASLEVLAGGEQLWERTLRNIATFDELRRIHALLLEAFPERPDTLAVIRSAVTVKVSARDLPYGQVPHITAAIYLVKEFWRERLLEEAINDAINGVLRGQTPEAEGSGDHEAQPVERIAA